MYGREPILPEDVDEPEGNAEADEPRPSGSEQHAEVNKRVTRMRESIGQKVLKNIKKAQGRQETHYNKRRISQNDIPVGTKVLKKNLVRSDRKGGKSALPWLGPYVIRSKTKSGGYLLTNEDGIHLKSSINGANLKIWHKGPSENEKK
ncbi:uncharacterized protein LOC135486772 [Lineus longissimus]|uniref:uncharacterized protein LOC135486772 n=1 Tax=Lineus longissimus TaxID=88925 RepID=UPI00315C848A